MQKAVVGMKSTSSSKEVATMTDTMTEDPTTVMMTDMMIEIEIDMTRETDMIAAIDAMTDDPMIATEIIIRGGDQTRDTRSPAPPQS